MLRPQRSCRELKARFPLLACARAFPPSRDLVKKMRTVQKDMLRVLGTHRSSLLQMVHTDGPEEAQEAVVGLDRGAKK